jgi:ribonuclease HII
MYKMKEKEKQRLQLLKEYEEQIYNSGAKYIAGIDEVGRGPLAGPVVIRCSNYEIRFVYRVCQ